MQWSKSDDGGGTSIVAVWWSGRCSEVRVVMVVVRVLGRCGGVEGAVE